MTPISPVPLEIEQYMFRSVGGKRGGPIEAPRDPKPWPPAELKGYGCGLDADDPAAELAGWLRARRYQPEPTQITVPLKYFDTLKKAQSKLTTWRIVAPFVVCGTLCIGALIGRAL